MFGGRNILMEKRKTVVRLDKWSDENFQAMETRDKERKKCEIRTLAVGQKSWRERVRGSGSGYRMRKIERKQLARKVRSLSVHFRPAKLSSETRKKWKSEKKESEKARAREREKRLSEDSEEELWRIESTLSSNNHVSCQHTRPTLKGHHYKGAFSPLSPARSCTPTNPHTYLDLFQISCR